MTNFHTELDCRNNNRKYLPDKIRVNFDRTEPAVGGIQSYATNHLFAGPFKSTFLKKKNLLLLKSYLKYVNETKI